MGKIWGKLLEFQRACGQVQQWSGVSCSHTTNTRKLALTIAPDLQKARSAPSSPPFFFLHQPLHIYQNNNTGKMSAIVEEPDGFYEPIKVLITLHEGMDTMDAIGPMEVFSLALHDKKVKGRLAMPAPT